MFSFRASKEKHDSRWWWRKLGAADLGCLGVVPLCNTHILMRLWNHFISWGAKKSACSSQIRFWVTGRQGANTQVVLHRPWYVAGGAWLVFHPCDGRKGWHLRCCREGEAEVIKWSLRSSLLYCPTQEPCALQLSNKEGMLWERWLWWCKHPLAAPRAAGAKSNHSWTQSWWGRGAPGLHSLGSGWRSCPAGSSNRDLERGCPMKLSTALPANVWPQGEPGRAVSSKNGKRRWGCLTWLWDTGKPKEMSVNVEMSL